MTNILFCHMFLYVPFYFHFLLPVQIGVSHVLANVDFLNSRGSFSVL